MRKLVLTFTLVLAIPLAAQERFASGDLKGFTRSPIEHIVVTLSEPFEVATVEGTILMEDASPLGDVLFEIRGPGSSERIRASSTDAKGKFKVKKVPEGTYMFKATKSGFQSVTGTLVVSRSNNGRKAIKIRMPVGV